MHCEVFQYLNKKSKQENESLIREIIYIYLRMQSPTGVFGFAQHEGEQL